MPIAADLKYKLFCEVDNVPASLMWSRYVNSYTNYVIDWGILFVCIRVNP